MTQQQDKKAIWLSCLTELQAIAQNGLTFCQNVFDGERYEQLKRLAAKMAAQVSDVTEREWVYLFNAEYGYATPKLDIRAAIFEGNHVLLVKENADGFWSLPGGWAEVGESPSVAIIREIQEETGAQANVIRLLALWDKLKHAHPPEWPHAYKCVFHCELKDKNFAPNHEILDVKFFPIENLPELSQDRITAKQIQLLYEIVTSNLPAAFD